MYSQLHVGRDHLWGGGGGGGGGGGTRSGQSNPAHSTEDKCGQSMTSCKGVRGERERPGSGREDPLEGAEDSSGHSMASSAAGGAGEGRALAAGKGVGAPRVPDEVRAAQDPEAERRAAGLVLLLVPVGSSMEGCPLRG